MGNDHLSSENVRALEEPRTITAIASKAADYRGREGGEDGGEEGEEEKDETSHLPYLAWESDISIVDVEVGTC